MSVKRPWLLTLISSIFLLFASEFVSASGLAILPWNHFDLTATTLKTNDVVENSKKIRSRDNGKTNFLPRQRKISQALRSAVQDDLRVSVLTEEEIATVLVKAGLRIEDNWGEEEIKRFFRISSAEYLLFGNIYKQKNSANSSLILLKRAYPDSYKILLREKIYLRGGEEDKVLRSFVKFSLKKIYPFFDLKRELLNSHRLETDLALDIVWILDFNASMQYYRGDIVNAIDSLWRRFSASFATGSLRFGFLPVQRYSSGKGKPFFDLDENRESWKQYLKLLMSKISQERHTSDITLNQLKNSLARFRWGGKDRIRILYHITDRRLLAGGLSYRELRNFLLAQRLHYFSHLYPGINIDELKFYRALSADTDAMSYPVPFLLRGYSANAIYQLINFGGQWFRFHGLEGNFTSAIFPRFLSYADKSVGTDGISMLTRQRLKSGSELWEFLGYHESKSLRDIFSILSKRETVRGDKSFPLKDFGQGLPSYSLQKWFSQKSPSFARADLKRFIIQDRKVSTWLYARGEDVNLLQKLMLSERSGKNIWLSARLIHDKNNPLDYVLDPDSLRLHGEREPLPELYKITLQDPVGKIKYYEKNGLGKQKRWFFRVRIMPAQNGIKSKDIRDF